MIKMPTLKNSADKFFPTSIRLPVDLHQRLLKKSEQMGQTSLNKTIQELLEMALHQQPLDKQLQYTVMLYALLREAIVSLVEEPESLLDRAEQKATKILGNYSSAIDL
jgi:hypothetical protein